MARAGIVTHCNRFRDCHDGMTANRAYGVYVGRSRCNEVKDKYRGGLGAFCRQYAYYVQIDSMEPRTSDMTSG